MEDKKTKELTVPIWEKYALTITEAAAYFGIGEKKIRFMVLNNPDEGCFILNGAKYLVKRKKFEAFLDKISSI